MDTPIVTGITKVSVTVFYESPCFVFFDLNGEMPSHIKIPNTYKYTNLHEWCEAKFKELFIDEIKTFCVNPIEDQGLKKPKKRAAFLAILVVISIAIATYAAVSTYDVGDKINNLNVHYNKLSKNLDKVEDSVKRIKEVLELMQTQMDAIAIDLEAVEAAMQKFYYYVPKMMTVLTTVITRLYIIRDRIRDVSRNWKNDIFDEKLLDIFNFTLPCLNEVCPSRLIEPVSCFYDSYQEKIIINFSMRNISRNIVMIESDPFIIYARQNNGTTLCPVVYSGPKRLLYNNQNQCILNVPISFSTSTQYMIISELTGCKYVWNNHSTVRYWQSGICEDEENHVDSVLTQIKSYGSENFIYCDTQMIRIQDRILNCPNYIFALSNTIEFSVGSLNYISNIIAFNTSVQYNDRLNKNINFHLMPNLNNFNFTRMSVKTRDKLHEIDIDFEERSFLQYEKDYLLIILFGIMIVSIMAKCIILLRNRKQKKMIKRNVKKEIKINFPERRPSIISNRSMNYRRRKAMMNHKRFSSDSDIDIINSMNSEIKSLSTPNLVRRVPNQHVFSIVIIFMMHFLKGLYATELSDSLTFTIYYKNPCIIMSSLNISEYESDWCLRLFRETFLLPLSKYCINHKNIKTLEKTVFNVEKTRAYLNHSIKNKRDIKSFYYDIFNSKSEVNFENNSKQETMMKSFVPDNKVNLKMYALAAQFFQIKSLISEIGTEWRRGLPHDKLVDSPYLEMDMKLSDLKEYKARSCFHDSLCRYIKLELVLKDKPYKTLSIISIAIATISTFTTILLCIKLRIKKNVNKGRNIEMSSSETRSRRLYIPAKVYEDISNFPINMQMPPPPSSMLEN